MVQYLKTGANSRTVAAGPMAEAVTNSLQHLSDSDLHAIAVYLKSLPGSKDDSAPLAANSAMANGKELYADNCAACHQNSGDGVRNMIPALKGNNGVQATQPTNILHVLMNGGQGAATASNPTSADMPEFGWKLTDQQMADVSTYIRNAWGNQAPAVSKDDVAKARKSQQGAAALHNPDQQ